MKITKIKIKNLFGIAEKELDGKSVEIRGTNGTGKTSVIDAIKYALTNSSERDYIIKNGETEGEIIVDKGFAQNGLPAESAFFFKFASRNVGGIQKGFTALRKGEGQEIDFFPQRKIRMESFGIRKGCAGGIENGGAHGKSVAAERIVVCDFVCEWVARRIAVKFAF